MKHSLLAIFLISALFSGNAQTFPPALAKKFTINRKLTGEYFVFEKNGKYGVVNNAGAIILPAIYGGIYNTRFDLFVVRIDENNKGVVRAKNVPALPFEFDNIDILSPQRIHVQKNELSFIVSSSNRFLADTTEEPITLFQMDGNMLTSPRIMQDELVPAFAPNNFLRMDKDIFIIEGKDTIKTAYQDIRPLANNGERIKFKKNDHWGIINNENKELVPAIYDEIEQDDQTGLTKVYKANKQSLLDAELKLLPAGPFDRIDYFTNNDIAVAGIDGQATLINSSGAILLQPIKGIITQYGEHFFEIRYDSGKIDIVDKNMKSILPAGTSAHGYIGNILLLITADKKMGAAHAAGYTLLQPIHDEVFFGNTDGEDNRLFQVRKGSKWGIVDLEGKQVIPYQFDKINLFSNGIAPAILNGKAGVITDKNKVIVPFIYDQTAYDYNELDLLEVKKDGLYGFVSKTGTVIIPVVYESVNDDFDGGLCLAMKNGKWGYLDKNGKTVIPFEYDEGSLFYSEKTRVRKANTWYEIDKTGKILSESPGK